MSHCLAALECDMMNVIQALMPFMADWDLRFHVICMHSP
jgi:hypothetical protein